MEDYSAIRDLYMRNGEGFVLVYSILAPSSLEELKAMREQIESVRGTNIIPTVLAGNKGDMETDRAVSKEDGQELASRWSSPCFETSAKDGNNIHEVFLQLTIEILRLRPFLANNPTPPKSGRRTACITM
jgi:small GTP-binding protein